MNYKPNPSIDLEFHRVLVVWQKKTFSMLFFWINYCEFFEFLFNHQKYDMAPQTWQPQQPRYLQLPKQTPLLPMCSFFQ